MSYVYGLPNGEWIEVDDSVPREQADETIRNSEEYGHLFPKAKQEDGEPGFFMRNFIGPAVAPVAAALPEFAGAITGMAGEATGSQATKDFGAKLLKAGESARAYIDSGPQPSFTEGFSKIGEGDIFGGVSELGSASSRTVSGLAGELAVPLAAAALAPEAIVSAGTVFLGTMFLQSLASSMGGDVRSQEAENPDAPVDFNAARDVTAATALTALNKVGFEAAGLHSLAQFGIGAEKKAARNVLSKALEKTAAKIHEMPRYQQYLVSGSGQGALGPAREAINRWTQNKDLGLSDSDSGSYLEAALGGFVGGIALHGPEHYRSYQAFAASRGRENNARNAISNLHDIEAREVERERNAALLSLEASYQLQAESIKKDAEKKRGSLTPTMENVERAALDRGVITDNVAFERFVKRVSGGRYGEDLTPADVTKIFDIITSLQKQEPGSAGAKEPSISMPIASEGELSKIAKALAKLNKSRKNKNQKVPSAISAKDIEMVIPEWNDPSISNAERGAIANHVLTALRAHGYIERIGGVDSLMKKSGGVQEELYQGVIEHARVLGRFPTLNDMKPFGWRNSGKLAEIKKLAIKRGDLKQTGGAKGTYEPVYEGSTDDGLVQHDYHVKGVSFYYARDEKGNVLTNRDGTPMAPFDTAKEAQAAIDAYKEQESGYTVVNSRGKIITKDGQIWRGKLGKANAARWMKRTGRSSYRVIKYVPKIEAPKRQRMYELSETKSPVLAPEKKGAERGPTASRSVVDYYNSLEEAKTIAQRMYDSRRGEMAPPKGMTHDESRARLNEAINSEEEDAISKLNKERAETYAELKKIAEVEEAFKRELSKRGLPFIRVNLTDKPGPRGEAGSYGNGIINIYNAKILLSSNKSARESAEETLAHESFHGLKALGLVSGAEEKSLIRFGETELAKDHFEKPWFKELGLPEELYETATIAEAVRLSKSYREQRNTVLYKGEEYVDSSLEDMERLSRALEENDYDKESFDHVFKEENIDHNILNEEIANYSLEAAKRANETKSPGTNAEDAAKGAKNAKIVKRIKSKTYRYIKALRKTANDVPGTREVIERLHSKDVIAKRMSGRGNELTSLSEAPGESLASVMLSKMIRRINGKTRGEEVVSNLSEFVKGAHEFMPSDEAPSTRAILRTTGTKIKERRTAKSTRAEADARKARGEGETKPPVVNEEKEGTPQALAGLLNDQVPGNERMGFHVIPEERTEGGVWPDGVPEDSNIRYTDSNGDRMYGVNVRVYEDPARNGILITTQDKASDFYDDIPRGLEQGKTFNGDRARIQSDKSYNEQTDKIKARLSNKAVLDEPQYADIRDELEGHIDRMIQSPDVPLSGFINAISHTLAKSRTGATEAGFYNDTFIGGYDAAAPHGNTVDVNVDRTNLLDIGKPLSEQPEKVKTALTRSGVELDSETTVKQLMDSIDDAIPLSDKQEPTTAIDHLTEMGIDGLKLGDGKGFMIWNRNAVKKVDPATGREAVGVLPKNVSVESESRLDNLNQAISENTDFGSWREAAADFLPRRDVVTSRSHPDGNTHYFAMRGAKEEPLVYIVDESNPNNIVLKDILTDGDYGRWYNETHDDAYPRLFSPGAKASSVKTALDVISGKSIYGNEKSGFLSGAFKKVDETISTMGDRGNYLDRMVPRHAKRKSVWNMLKRILENKTTTYDNFAKAMLDQYRPLFRLSQRFKEKFGDPLTHLVSRSAHAMALMTDRTKLYVAASFEHGVLRYDRDSGDLGVKDFKLKNGRGLNIYNEQGHGGLRHILAPLMYDSNGKNKGMDELDILAAGRLARRGFRLSKEGKLIPFKEEDMKIALANMESNPMIMLVDDNLNRYNEQYVDFLVQSGIISKSLRDNWLKYSDYIPYYSSLYEADPKADLVKEIRSALGEKGVRAIKVLSGKNPHMKFKGGETGSVMPMLEAMTKNMFSGYLAGTKNIAATKAAYEAARLGEARIVKNAKDSHMRILVDGEEHYVQFDEPGVAMTVIGNFEGMNPLFTVLGKASNLLRESITRAPPFIIRNTFRDSESTYINTGEAQNGVVSPLFGLAASAESIKNNAAYFAGGDFSPEYQSLQKYGAGGAGFDLGNVYEGSRALQHSLENYGDHFRNPVAAMKWLWEKSGDISSISESAAREGVYRRVLAKTGDPMEAAYQAMEVLNFTRRGSSSAFRAVTTMVPFLNARMQGIDVFGRSLAGEYTASHGVDTAGARARVIRRAAMLVGTAMAYGKIMETNPLYNSLIEEKRWNNWLIPTSKDSGILVPIPFEHGMVAKVAENMVRLVDGTDSPSEFGRSFRDVVSTQMSIGLPQAIKPVMEYQTGYDFFTGRSYLPKFREEGPYATKIGSNAIISKIGEATGLNPSRLEHLVKGYTGTLGMYALIASDHLARPILGEPSLPSHGFIDNPIIKPFVATSLDGGEKQAFYRLRNNLDDAIAAMHYYESRPDKAKSIKEKNKDLLGLKTKIRGIDRRLARINKKIRTVSMSDKPPKEKARIIDKLKKKQKGLTENSRELLRKANIRVSGGIR